VVAREGGEVIPNQSIQLPFRDSLKIACKRPYPIGMDLRNVVIALAPPAGCPNVGNHFLEGAQKFVWPECGLTLAFFSLADTRYPPASSFDSIEIEKARLPSHYQCRQLVAISPGQHELAEHEVELFA
jgi:hypothetical protein